VGDRLDNREKLGIKSLLVAHALGRDDVSLLKMLAIC
jgi:hypothetical protein